MVYEPKKSMLEGDMDSMASNTDGVSSHCNVGEWRKPDCREAPTWRIKHAPRCPWHAHEHRLRFCSAHVDEMMMFPSTKGNETCVPIKVPDEQD